MSCDLVRGVVICLLFIGSFIATALSYPFDGITVTSIAFWLGASSGVFLFVSALTFGIWNIIWRS